jgi:hypothetical protein
VPKGDTDARSLFSENVLLRLGTLVFMFSFAGFEVEKADDVVGADADASYATYSILSDIPRPSTWIGHIIIPNSTSSPPLCEFVVLSRAGHDVGLYDEDVLGQRYVGCMLYVMAVQKMQDAR